jgi:predicted nucleic acid-binding Zn ribbon protein
MDNTVQDQKKENRKFLIWFLIAVLIALLPWLFIAD